MVNPILQAGLFFLMLGFAFFFTFITFKKGDFPLRAGLRLVAMALFCIIAVFIGSGYEIAYHVDSNIHNTITNETWVGGDDNMIIDGGTSTSWLAYLFYGFAMMNLILIAKDFTVWKEKEENRI